jgi:hypothetical protein
MSVYYPTMSTEERQSVLSSDLDGDLRAGRWFGAACMAGSLAVLGADPAENSDPDAWRDAALRDLEWTDPKWLERVAALESDDDIRRLILLLRIDEAGCGIGFLRAHPAAIIAEMDAICMVIHGQPDVWGRIGTAALRRLNELEAAPFPNPAIRVWKAVFQAWRASVEVETTEMAAR